MEILLGNIILLGVRTAGSRWFLGGSRRTLADSCLGWHWTHFLTSKWPEDATMVP